MEDINLLIALSKFLIMSIEDKVLFFFKKNISKKVQKGYIINNHEYLDDEAFFLMNDFFKEFDINSGYLDIEKYFNPTPSPLGCLFSWLLLSPPKYKQKHPVIKVSHMIEVAKRKEWFDPEEV